MAHKKTLTEVSRPGTTVKQALRDAVPAAPKEHEREAFRRDMQRLEQAERTADEQSRAIKIH